MKEDLKYPVGKYLSPSTLNDEEIRADIQTIASLPEELEKLTGGLSVEQKQWHYRPEGWTIAQVVHHCADSHMNSFMRFKLTLTEDTPTIKPYEEGLWAELPDAGADVDTALSLQLLKNLHKRWVILLESLSKEQLDREFIHPELHKKISLRESVHLYAWHCKHHTAHIKQALQSKGEFA